MLNAPLVLLLFVLYFIQKYKSVQFTDSMDDTNILDNIGWFIGSVLP